MDHTPEERARVLLHSMVLAHWTHQDAKLGPDCPLCLATVATELKIVAQAVKDECLAEAETVCCSEGCAVRTGGGCTCDPKSQIIAEIKALPLWP